MTLEIEILAFYWKNWAFIIELLFACCNMLLVLCLYASGTTVWLSFDTSASIPVCAQQNMKKLRSD